MGKSKLVVIFSISLLLLGTLFFAGCGQKAADSNVIKIGGNFELTGGVANYGNKVLNGVKLAFKQANDAGGINGKKIELIIADNKSEPSEATSATTKLITQDKVVLVTGPVTSSNVLATLQVGADSKVAIVTGTATNPTVTVDDKGNVRPFAFRACFIDPFQGTVMSKFTYNTLKAKKAVILFDSSSDYSKELQDVFAKDFTKLGGQIIAKEAFLAKDQDFKAILTKIKSLNPDVIYIPAYYEEVGKIINQARELGITCPLVGSDGWDDPKVVEIAGAKALNNTYFSNHYSAQDTDPNIVKFITAYKQEYNGEEPNALSALGYDSGVMIVDALKRAGSLEPEKIAAALATISNLQVGTGVLTMDDKHNPIKSAVVIEMLDGNQVMKEKINP